MDDEAHDLSSRFNWGLAGAWLATSFISLILPVFFPSYPWHAVNPIGASSVTMFLLSFPSSVFAIPVAYMASLALDIDPGTIGGRYITLLTFFIFGIVQWFWILPRVWRPHPYLQVIELLDDGPKSLNDPVKRDAPEFFDADARTPLERVIDEE